VYTALLQRGIIVRPMQGYGLPSWQRITVGTAADNEALLSAIDAAGLQAPTA
jgi:histidinol-phosphate aminotransferase